MCGKISTKNPNMISKHVYVEISKFDTISNNLMPYLTFSLKVHLKNSKFLVWMTILDFHCINLPKGIKGKKK